MQRFALMFLAFAVGFFVASFCENGAPPTPKDDAPLVAPDSAAALTASAETSQTSWNN
jgi:hypothetical protein